MTGLLDREVVAFDTETTGIDVHNDRIVTACLVYFAPGLRPIAENWLINPGIPIPEEATAVHGITTQHAQACGDDPSVAVYEITNRLTKALSEGIPVVAFNAAFDLTILEAENTRHANPTLFDQLDGRVKPIVDPMVLDKFADPYRKGICKCGCGAVNKTLAGCCTHYGVPLVAAHSAESDAASAVRLARAILAKHANKFRGYHLDTITDWQADWRAEQMNSLRAYFDKNGIEHDGCHPGFPIQTPISQQGALL